ncbi:MAG: flavodoxin domain-containing protein [Candidatus Thorarchaeota archaeon]
MNVLVVYESTRGRTKAMAEAVGDGVKSEGVECEVVEAKKFSGLNNACALAVGSSTRMKKTLPQTRQVLAEMGKLNGLPAGAFGSYGWSGEAPDIISNELSGMGGTLVSGQPVKAKDHPNAAALESCRELGRTLAKKCG